MSCCAATHEEVHWGTMPVGVTTYISDVLPPLELVTSVRAVVLHGTAAVVIHDGVDHHVLPGGRREPGESVEATLAREVSEETGYTLKDSKVLGFMHFQHLGPKPTGYSYPYPDFFQVVFAARAGQYRPEDMVEDEYVKRSELMSAEDVLMLGLPPGEHAYLRAALKL